MIALLTDFGTKDWFAASMKGAILSVDPSATIIDITHEIAAGDVRTGAFELLACFADFPPGTVFVAVVDPGVGSERGALAARAGDYCFVAPDNGLLSFVFNRFEKAEVHQIDNPAYAATDPCRTFHGRDVFGPVAAHLGKGVPLAKIGASVETYVKLPWPQVFTSENTIIGHVVYIDRFGNAVTSIESAAFSAKLKPGSCRVRAGEKEVPFRKFYREVKEGKPLALWGSAGFLEISINCGNAGSELGLHIGDTVEIVMRR